MVSHGIARRQSHIGLAVSRRRFHTVTNLTHNFNPHPQNLTIPYVEIFGVQIVKNIIYFSWDSSNRMTPDEALKHDFFYSERDSRHYKVCILVLRLRLSK